jgi:hypothetical protein
LQNNKAKQHKKKKNKTPPFLVKAHISPPKFIGLKEKFVDPHIREKMLKKQQEELVEKYNKEHGSVSKNGAERNFQASKKSSNCSLISETSKTVQPKVKKTLKKSNSKLDEGILPDIKEKNETAAKSAEDYVLSCNICREKLEKLFNHYSSFLELQLPSEVTELLHSTLQQTTCILKERLKNFNELCKRGTNLEDLGDLWRVIRLQVSINFLS